MDVSAVGAAGPAIPPGEATLSRVLAPAVTETLEDSVGALVELLATPQIHDLLNSIDAQRSSHGSTALDNYLQAAVSAVADHDVPRALAHLTEYIRQNPGHADALPATPSLMPIQGAVQELLRHITIEAKIEAERMIVAASLVVGTAAEAPRTLNGPDVLAIAQRFAETGQLVNYIRASELSQAVITSYSAVVPDVRASVLRRQLPELIRASWRRVPLLVLLAGWFALGLAGAAISLLARVAGAALSPAAIQGGFELWGVGFLALVAVQFLISIRNARFKN
ncbi:MAG: hypothetical protein ABSG41_12270 [Bryobacteraceae bacterium]|jgi:hypothetical protein